MSRELATAVYVNGEWYQPGDDLPAEVEAAITNPACFTDGPSLPVTGFNGAFIPEPVEVDGPDVPQDEDVEHPEIDGVEPLEVTADGSDKVVSAGPPPKAGAGSGLDEWTAYAEEHDVHVGEDAKRADVIAALDAAGIPTERP